MSHWLVSTIGHLGYLGIGLLMFLENIILPLPSELIMPLSGFVASRGRLDVGGVLVAGFVGELVGAYPWYFLGRSMGRGRVRDWLDQHGKWLLLRRKELDRAQQWFEGKGRFAVLLGRLVPGVHSLIGVPAGVARMGLVPFTLYSAVGVAVWVGGLGWAGFLLGGHFKALARFLKPAGYAAGGLLLLALVWWLVRRRRRALRR
ncbi:MAG TPA: DedA family protein [Longimicrobiales bacterium]